MPRLKDTRSRILEKQAQDLRDSNEKLKIKEAELRSMYNIEEKTKGSQYDRAERRELFDVAGKCSDEIKSQIIKVS